MVEVIEDSKPTNKRHIKNLLKLADFLQNNVPPPRFNMRSYFTVVDEESLEEYNRQGVYNREWHNIDFEEISSVEELLAKQDNPAVFIADNGKARWIEDISKKAYNSCGTVACALGHAPLALNMRKSKISEYGSWDDLAKDKFGVGYGAWGSHDFQWLFGSDWEYTDNTPQGAAARIRFYVENGTPDEHYSMQRGRVPLPYEVVPYNPATCVVPAMKKIALSK